MAAGPAELDWFAVVPVVVPVGALVVGLVVVPVVVPVAVLGVEPAVELVAGLVIELAAEPVAGLVVFAEPAKKGLTGPMNLIKFEAYRAGLKQLLCTGTGVALRQEVGGQKQEGESH